MRLKLEGKTRSTMFKFLEIPDELIKKVGMLLGKEKDGILYEETKSEVSELFDKLWKSKEKETESVLGLLNESVKKYDNWLIRQPPIFTGIPWHYEEVFVYPNIHSWATKAGNYISVGITPSHFLREELVPVLIHELVHINTDQVKLDYLKYPQDSDEIANTLLTNKIIQAMNKQFNILVPDLKLAAPFREYNKYANDLAKIVENADNFSSVAEKVDQFLISKAHLEIYKK